ncbi:nitrate regulatory protein [Aquisalimonas sp.]|uniref:nitrate regulatory protein n=1 Tax=Aquisalimonas sp. TaxID=1872621 RepID=UPI0025C6F881|nr:nitrate regulatory protein [Aquisalimonas sp.]
MDKSSTSSRSVADYLIASKNCEIVSLEQLLRTGRLVVSISNLVHALQRERGASNLYLASAGERFAHELPGLREQALASERQFRDCLGQIDLRSGAIPGASRLFSRIAYAIQGLEEVRAVRDEITPQRVAPEAVLEGYSALIRGLLAVVFEAADTALDPDISRKLVAMFHLMQGKEFAGQERAVGAAGFARGGFDAPAVERLRHLIENQERCFQIFASFADTETLAAWEDTETGGASGEVERLRRIACTSAPGRVTDTAISDVWFNATTHRIDGMKRVEDRVEASLEALCQQKIADARADLDSHAHHIEALTRQPGDQPSFAIFFSDGTEPLNSDCAGPQLGRSLIDLVQCQSARLQAMSDELNEARAALMERKSIEKAKGLIMRHRDISEEEAYRFLRQVAMSQSRRLAEVAADTIAMEKLFKC